MEQVRKQQEKAARNGMELSFEEAYEEMVADSMEGILTSGNVVELMAEVKLRDVTLWEKLREWFRGLAEDIKKLVRAYRGYKPDSVEGRAVASMKELLPVIEGFYADALMEASENRQMAEGQKNTTREGGNAVQYSIRKNVTDVNGNMYDNVIELEYRIFNKIRKSTKAYINFIRNNLIKEKITVYDNNGESEIIEFAKENERVRKDGKSSFHRVLGELERAQGDIKKLIITNAEEVAKISKIEKHSEENRHQWMDQNGWEKRWSYVMTCDGTIYPVILHIAKTRDGRNLLYSVNVDITKGIGIDKGVTVAPSNNQVQQTVKVPTPSGGIVTQENVNVKKKLSARDFGGSEPSDAKTECFRDFEAQDDLYQQMVEEYIAGDDERVQHRRRNRWKNSKEPADAWEWSVFNRSFANKTNGLKSGGTRNIMITTADYAYFVAADGYMSGEIVAKMNLNTQMREIEEFRKGFVYADTGTKTLDSMAETLRNDRGGNDWDHAGDGYTREAGQPDVLDGRSQGSDSLGYYWENYGYPSYDELIEAIESGAMVMDDNGDLITLPDGWDQHRSDDEDYERWLREVLAREG